MKRPREGLVCVVEEACKLKKISLRGASVAIQGFGNAGATAARLFAEKKAKIVALGDTRGAVTNPRGIDPIKAIRYKERSGTVVGMPGASRFSNDELLTMKCDILVPAALENVITLHNAEAVKARIVAEAANGPTTPHADEILARRGITVLPDILANAGGVTVSYFEWVQNQEGLMWDVDEVNARLQKVMVALVHGNGGDDAQASRSAACRRDDCCRRARRRSHAGARPLPVKSLAASTSIAPPDLHQSFSCAEERNARTFASAGTLRGRSYRHFSLCAASLPLPRSARNFVTREK